MTHVTFSGRRILVVGDVMLDTYLTGSASRISPEAPVPVLLRQDERAVLGGAANVVANLAALGAGVDVIGVIGRDEAAARLTAMLAAFPNVETRHLVVDPNRPTTCKTRVMSGLHQLVRIDAEHRAAMSADVEAQMIQALDEALPRAEVVVLSDYAKGLCSDRMIRAVVDRAAAAGKPVIIDPKRRDFSIYRGARVIKPNRRELVEATDMPCDTDAEVEAAARAVIAQTGATILLTRSEHGMSWIEEGREPLHIETAARDVFDVSGAGDTVMALVALGLAARLPIAELVRVANAAAGVVVGKVGTAVVTPGELDRALAAQSHVPGREGGHEKGARLPLAEAVQAREAWRRQGLVVGFTNGVYDLLHPGHVSLLRQAADACDRLIVAINSDASVRRLKGPTRPVQDEASRATVLGALSAVDLVIVFEEDTPAEAIQALVPDLLVKGADYTVDTVVGADTVRAAGGRVMLAPIVEGQSTTSMIRRSTASR